VVRYAPAPSRGEKSEATNMYESDLTKFMREFLEKNPEVAEKQKAARATWWDKKLDADERRQWEDSRLPEPSYQYYDKP
jgi:hypothetical protein